MSEQECVLNARMGIRGGHIHTILTMDFGAQSAVMKEPQKSLKRILSRLKIMQKARKGSVFPQRPNIKIPIPNLSGNAPEATSLKRLFII